MRRKSVRTLLVVELGIVLIILLFGAWLLFGSATEFRSDKKYLYIPSDSASKETVMMLLQRDSIMKHPKTFNLLANKKNYWTNIKPGKYLIDKGESVFSLVRKLRNGTQEPVNIVIVKFRTREALAGALGKKLECDSTQILAFMNNPDSVKQFGVDTNTVMSIIFPDTYTHFWNTTPRKVFGKFYEAYKATWTDERKSKAAAHGLSPAAAYILASIIEEETNDKSDKPLMASVYLNRMKQGMRLGADPTVKFALRDFELKRIYEKHLAAESPYNTYRNYGLPPGPICTPSLESLDAVLNSPTTDYLYFVAKSDFSGKHVFTSSYNDHLKFAKEYQQALNAEMEKRRAKEETE